MTPQKLDSISPTPIFDGFNGEFDSEKLRFYERITREMIIDLNALKAALAEFDSYRHVWAEIVANNVPPGRDSELRNRMEVMQGRALMNIDACARQLQDRIRGKIK